VGAQRQVELTTWAPKGKATWKDGCPQGESLQKRGRAPRHSERQAGKIGKKMERDPSWQDGCPNTTQGELARLLPKCNAMQVGKVGTQTQSKAASTQDGRRKRPHKGALG
jgi:hypothetical protein